MAKIKETDSSIGHETEVALQIFTLSRQLKSSTPRIFFHNTSFELELEPMTIEWRDNSLEAFFSRYILLYHLVTNHDRMIESITHWHFALIVALVKGNPCDIRHQVLSRIPGSQPIDGDQHG
ncbi:hypothetical protein N7G274_003811 [Stereocaulon virgatum]|uniref:Uncharacterized protein n=1 Tax=Stereocaulon virgatum TaxID=373712 RepID=A0ABR4AFM0_9LECA